MLCFLCVVVFLGEKSFFFTFFFPFILFLFSLSLHFQKKKNSL